MACFAVNSACAKSSLMLYVQTEYIFRQPAFEQRFLFSNFISELYRYLTLEIKCIYTIRTFLTPSVDLPGKMHSEDIGTTTLLVSLF